MSVQTDNRVEIFFIPFIGPSTNKIYSGVNWRKRKRVTDDGHLVCMHTLGRKIKTFDYPVTITFIPSLGRNNRGYDVSNYSYTAKIIEDGLVMAGLLVDDNSKWVKRLITEESIKDRTKPSGVWVKVERYKEGWCEDCYRIAGTPFEAACAACVK